jgi:Na+/H+-translocating membrane pyrophosphatase
MNRETFTLVVGYSVTGLWLIMNVLSALIKDLEINPTLNVAAMAVVGSAFGASLIQRGGDDGRRDRRE